MAHTTFIAAAYAAGALILGVLIIASWVDNARQKRRLEALETAGKRDEPA